MDHCSNLLLKSCFSKIFKGQSQRKEDGQGRDFLKENCRSGDEDLHPEIHFISVQLLNAFRCSSLESGCEKQEHSVLVSE